jgi:hypothetical protein
MFINLFLNSQSLRFVLGFWIPQTFELELLWFSKSLFVDFVLVCCFVHILWNFHLVFSHAIFDGSIKTSYEFLIQAFFFSGFY